MEELDVVRLVHDVEYDPIILKKGLEGIIVELEDADAEDGGWVTVEFSNPKFTITLASEEVEKVELERRHSEHLYQRICNGWTGYTMKEAALAILCRSPTEIVQLLMALKPKPEKLDTTI